MFGFEEMKSFFELEGVLRGENYMLEGKSPKYNKLEGFCIFFLTAVLVGVGGD